MDAFGIGSAMKSIVRTYIRSSRRTGRTSALVESLKDGDRVVFLTNGEGERVRSLCEERGVGIRCLVCDPNDIDYVFQHGTSQGRTVFDHSWLEEYYQNVIEKAVDRVDYVQAQSSGYGEAHLKTKRQAVEISKWRVG